MKCVQIRIFGQVQGVTFRYNALRLAKKLGLKGYAKNLEDKSVIIVAKGKDEKVDRFISWCEKGPKYAHVQNIKVKRADFDGNQFEIKY